MYNTWYYTKFHTYYLQYYYLFREEDPTATKQIFKSVREEISESGFQNDDPDEQIKIISGQDEGIGLWVTANYVAGNLGNVSIAIVVFCRLYVEVIFCCTLDS